MKAWKGFPKEYWMYWVSKFRMMSLILFGEAAILIFYMLLGAVGVAAASLLYRKSMNAIPVGPD